MSVLVTQFVVLRYTSPRKLIQRVLKYVDFCVWLLLLSMVEIYAEIYSYGLFQ